MATTANIFSELEHIGELEPFATRREFLNQLRLSGEREKERQEEEERQATELAKTLSAGIGKFSDAEIDCFKSEGWTVVPSRERTRPIESPSLDTATSDAPSDVLSDELGDDSAASAEVVVPRALPPVVPAPDAVFPTDKRRWRCLRWGAIGVLGAFALAKVAARR